MSGAREARSAVTLSQFQSFLFFFFGYNTHILFTVQEMSREEYNQLASEISKNIKFMMILFCAINIVRHVL